MMLTLDHITIATGDLSLGVAYAERSLGIAVPPGGKHPIMATHNHLFRLDEGVFLEVIAPDLDADPPARRRWFDLDSPDGPAQSRSRPRLSTWVLRTPSIADALALVEGAQGPVVRVTHGDLSWMITVPDDGSMPYEGAFPTLIEWPPGPHPAETMADRGCRLRRLTVEHPRGDRIAAALSPHLRDPRIAIRPGAAVRLCAEVETPNGLRILD